MPLDVLGCTRVTLVHSASYSYDLETIVCNLLSMRRDGDRLLKLLVASEEFLIGAGHQPVSITSLPFVHTARRSYRLSGPANNPDHCVS